MKIAVIVPVVQTDLAYELLEAIVSNTVKPSVCVIVDNSEDGSFSKRAKDFAGTIPMIMHRENPRLAVNASWTKALGTINGKADVVSFLNDDLIINPEFFDKITKSFRALPMMGGVCPVTVKRKEDVLSGAGKDVVLDRMRKREGWAFSMPTKVIAKCPPIPSSLKNFCGDDWFWWWSHQHGYFWCYMINNQVFHYVGSSIRRFGLQKTCSPEKAVFVSLLDSLMEAEKHG